MVYGHHGIPDNEAADALGNKASATPYVAPEPVLRINLTTV